MGYRTRLHFGQAPSNKEIYSALTSGERILFWIAGVNFVAFLVLWFFIGGSALEGGIEDGRYHVGSDGARREVSGFIFGYSLVHILTLFATRPIGVLLGFRGRRRVLEERRSR